MEETTSSPIKIEGRISEQTPRKAAICSLLSSTNGPPLRDRDEPIEDPGAHVKEEDDRVNNSLGGKKEEEAGAVTRNDIFFLLLLPLLLLLRSLDTASGVCGGDCWTRGGRARPPVEWAEGQDG